MQYTMSSNRRLSSGKTVQRRRPHHSVVYCFCVAATIPLKLKYQVLFPTQELELVEPSRQ